MAKGLPDYYRGVDITYQTLGQVINRPKYGAGDTAISAVVVAANAETEIISVSGKGMIYGGDLGVSPVATQHNSVPVLEVDGENISERSFFSANYLKINKEHAAPFYQLLYNPTEFIFSVGISHGITFETGFRVLYQEEHGDTPSVSARAIYALV